VRTIVPRGGERAWGCESREVARAYINARRTIRLRRAVSTVAGRHTTIPADRQARFFVSHPASVNIKVRVHFYTYPFFLFARVIILPAL